MTKKFEDSGQNLKYETRYIAFIDILGFKNIIKKSEKTTDEFEYIEKIIDIFKSFESTSVFTVTQFSDSVVISTKDSYEDFNKLLDCLFMMSIKSIGIWYLLRGGITRGKLVHTDKYLFGPAMNRAYQLENEIAIFPRIIVDECLNDSINKLDNHLLTQDIDGIYFLNFLNQKTLSTLSKETVKTHLDSIRDLINNFNYENITDLRIKQKYSWLSNKLSNFIIYNHDYLKEIL